MVELTEDVIDAIKKIKDAAVETGFFINKFEVSESGVDEPIIELEIRRKKCT